MRSSPALAGRPRKPTPGKARHASARERHGSYSSLCGPVPQPSASLLSPDLLGAPVVHRVRKLSSQFVLSLHRYTFAWIQVHAVSSAPPRDGCQDFLGSCGSLLRHESLLVLYQPNDMTAPGIRLPCIINSSASRIGALARSLCPFQVIPPTAFPRHAR